MIELIFIWLFYRKRSASTADSDGKSEEPLTKVDKLDEISPSSPYDEVENQMENMLRLTDLPIVNLFTTRMMVSGWLSTACPNYEEIVLKDNK